MKARITREQLPIAAMARFWKTDPALSAFLALLLVLVFVLPPLGTDGPDRSFVMDIVFALLLISGVLALSERGFARLVLTPIAVVTILIHFADWLVPVRRTSLEIASLVSLVVLFVVVLAQTFRSGPVNLHRIQGAVAAYLLLGVICADAYFLIELFHPGSFSGPISAENGARGWLYFSFVTLTTVGYGDVLPVHPVAQSLAIFEAVAGPMYLAILLARLVSLAVAAPAEPGSR